jgi:hypothetical protein
MVLATVAAGARIRDLTDLGHVARGRGGGGGGTPLGPPGAHRARHRHTAARASRGDRSHAWPRRPPSRVRVPVPTLAAGAAVDGVRDQGGREHGAAHGRRASPGAPVRHTHLRGGVHGEWPSSAPPVVCECAHARCDAMPQRARHARVATDGERGGGGVARLRHAAGCTFAPTSLWPHPPPPHARSRCWAAWTLARAASSATTAARCWPRWRRTATTTSDGGTGGGGKGLSVGM